MVRKQRRGIGYVGRVFQYGTAMAAGGAQLKRSGPADGQEDNTRRLNKDPAFKRANKKVERRADIKFAS